MSKMIPLPTWRNLFGIILAKSIENQELAKPWLREGEDAFFFSKTAWSLQAIALWWKNITGKSIPTIWFPDYFCNTSLQLLRDIKVNLIFYPIDENLQPCWEACQKMVEKAPPDIFVVVHYFGKPAEVILAKKFCKLKGSLLVEDAAHVLKAISGVGEHGDFILYSPHKLLAIPDGAICVMRNPQALYVNVTRGCALETMERVQREMASTTAFPWMWLLKRMLQKVLPTSFIRRKKAAFEASPLGGVMIGSTQTVLARKLLAQNISHLNAFAQKRNEMAESWRFLLANDENLQPFFQTSSGIPYLMPFQVGIAEDAGLIYARLLQQGLPVSTWPDLPPEVEGKNSFAKVLRKTLIVLPVHHTLKTRWVVGKFFPFFYKDLKRNNYTISTCITKEEWNILFSKIQQSNLLQSWDYGQAKKEMGGWHIKRFFIFKEDKCIGLYQSLERYFFIFIRIVRINRGPLWIEHEPLLVDIYNVFFAIKKACRWYKRSVLFIAPELSNQMSHKLLLNILGYVKKQQYSWQSVWINLSFSQEILRKKLHQKWRNQLVSAEKENLNFILSVDEQDFKWLIEQYKEDQIKKNFCGPSAELLTAYFSHKNTLIALVYCGEERMAGALFALHGLDSTYLLGFNDEKGRQVYANNFLLWNAMLRLQEKGVLWLDLGGLGKANKREASVSKFKLGLGGDEYQLVGEYICF